MPSHFEHFLHRARRQWTAWSIAEHAGLGLLCGCLCVVLLLPILLWRETPGLRVAVVFPLLGIIAGMIAGFRGRPGLGEVARIADERFGTADLLATALALRGSSEPWHGNILKMADACALGLSPAAVTPHRLGTRAWSGIALALIAAITLGLLSATLEPDHAQAVAAAVVPGVVPGSLDEWQPAAGHASDSISPDSAGSREAKAEQTPDSQSMPDGGATAQGEQAGGQSAHSTREGQAVAGAGEGSARTDSAQVALPTAIANSHGNDSPAVGEVATAGQGDETRARSDEGTTSGEISAVPGNAVAPWSISDWPAAQAAAARAIDNGHVPDAYRNLVRDYFDGANQDGGASP